jgi:hypothetical protein
MRGTNLLLIHTSSENPTWRSLRWYMKCLLRYSLHQLDSLDPMYKYGMIISAYLIGKIVFEGLEFSLRSFRSSRGEPIPSPIQIGTCGLSRDCNEHGTRWRSSEFPRASGLEHGLTLVIWWYSREQLGRFCEIVWGRSIDSPRWSG